MAASVHYNVWKFHIEKEDMGAIYRDSSEGVFLHFVSAKKANVFYEKYRGSLIQQIPIYRTDNPRYLSLKSVDKTFLQIIDILWFAINEKARGMARNPYIYALLGDIDRRGRFI